MQSQTFFGPQKSVGESASKLQLFRIEVAWSSLVSAFHPLRTLGHVGP
jgi:hypothetical protein